MTPRSPHAADTEGRSGGPQSANPPHPQDGRLSHITPGHVRAFQAISSGLFDNITLWSCRVNGDPGVAIVMVNHVGEGKVAVMPLFVAITENMTLSFDDETESDGGGGGGPKRANPDTSRMFAANKAALEPGGAK